MEIVIIDSGYSSYAFEKEVFEENGFGLKIHPLYKGDPAEKKEFAKNADGILVRHTIIDDAFLSGMKNLKAVVRYGVGYDNVDVGACSRHGVKVANVQGYANHSVSDHALAMIFICCRALWDPKTRLSGQFASPPVPEVFELHDKTLGIIGIGKIGSVFCQKASPLFRQVIACDPYKPDDHFEELSVQRVGLDELLEKSDVISIHCNLTEETKYMIDAGAFLKMKKCPVIINTSRGGVVGEKALLDALLSGRVHSAGLDVYEDEPFTTNQKDLIDHPRTVCTGHYAWYSDRAALELQRRAALNLLHFLTGKPVEDSLN